MNEEVFWAGAWALCHVVGFIVMFILRQRSKKQLQVAQNWKKVALPEDMEEADELIILTSDRHRRNESLLLVAFGYFMLGFIVLTWTIQPWMSLDAYKIVNRTILTGGEIVWIGSAWMSVATGDRITKRKRDVKLNRAT